MTSCIPTVRALLASICERIAAR